MSDPEPNAETREDRAPSRRSIIIAVVAMVALFALLYGWRAIRTPKPPEGGPPPVSVAAVQVLPEDAPSSLEAVGSLRAVREVMLAPEVAGRVNAIRFEAGSQVRAGTLLVQLFDGPERADRRAAASRASFAGIQLQRSETLAPTGAEPRELLQQRRAEREQARAAVAQFDARIVQKQIRAPFSGVLGVRQINLGQYLSPGDAVATLTALDQLFVDFTLPQQDLARVRVGAQVVVTADAWPGRSFLARVNAVEPRIGTDTRNISVQGTIANGDHALKPGMYVTAALSLPPERGALIVPLTAVQTSASGDSVILVRGPDARKTGKAEIVPVQTGRRIGNRVIVTRGVKAGDVIVTEGQLRIQPGATLNVAPPKPVAVPTAPAKAR